MSLQGVRVLGIGLLCLMAVVRWSQACDECQPARGAEEVAAVRCVRKVTAAEMEAMQAMSRRLRVRLQALVEKEQELTALRRKAMSQAAQLREQYLAAEENDCAHLDQLRADLSLRLAEATGHKAAIEKLAAEKRTAREEYEQLVVKIHELDANLTLIDVKEARQQLRQLTDRSSQLMAQLDRLLPPLGKERTAQELRVSQFLETEADQERSSGGPQPRAARGISVKQK